MTLEIFPPWYLAAEKEIGMKEQGDNAGPYIERLIRESHCGHLHDPWCAIFVNAKLEVCGIRGTRSPSSQSFRSDPNFVKLPGPARGALVVFWRISKNSGLGHVGFYDGENAAGINTLGGNETDAVRRQVYNPNRATLGLRGFYWPASVPLPVTGKLPILKAGSAGGKVT